MMIPARQDDDTKVERARCEHIAVTAANVAHQSGRPALNGREENEEEKKREEILSQRSQSRKEEPEILI